MNSMSFALRTNIKSLRRLQVKGTKPPSALPFFFPDSFFILHSCPYPKPQDLSQRFILAKCVSQISNQHPLSAHCLETFTFQEAAQDASFLVSLPASYSSKKLHSMDPSFHLSLQVVKAVPSGLPRQCSFFSNYNDRSKLSLERYRYSTDMHSTRLKF